MGLGFVKIGVDAVVCEEGVVGSVFGDAAVVEDDDAVAEFAAAHAVGDVDSGFAGGHLAELFVDFSLSDRVEGCGRLVEDDERGILEELSLIHITEPTIGSRAAVGSSRMTNGASL